MMPRWDGPALPEIDRVGSGPGEFSGFSMFHFVPIVPIEWNVHEFSRYYDDYDVRSGKSLQFADWKWPS